MYVLMDETEPIHVYTHLEPIRRHFDKWVKNDPPDLEDDFNAWLLDHDEYSGRLTDEQCHNCWKNFLDEYFDMGIYGNYAWYECLLD